MTVEAFVQWHRIEGYTTKGKLNTKKVGRPKWYTGPTWAEVSNRIGEEAWKSGLTYAVIGLTIDGVEEKPILRR